MFPGAGITGVSGFSWKCRGWGCRWLHNMAALGQHVLFGCVLIRGRFIVVVRDYSLPLLMMMMMMMMMIVGWWCQEERQRKHEEKAAKEAAVEVELLTHSHCAHLQLTLWTCLQIASQIQVDWKLVKCGSGKGWRKSTGWARRLMREFYMWFKKIGR